MTAILFPSRRFPCFQIKVSHPNPYHRPLSTWSKGCSILCQSILISSSSENAPENYASVPEFYAHVASKMKLLYASKRVHRSFFLLFFIQQGNAFIGFIFLCSKLWAYHLINFPTQIFVLAICSPHPASDCLKIYGLRMFRLKCRAFLFCVQFLFTRPFWGWGRSFFLRFTPNSRPPSSRLLTFGLLSTPVSTPTPGLAFHLQTPHNFHSKKFSPEKNASPLAALIG